MTKSVGVALVLGFLVTGLGHVFLGYVRRGIFFIIIDILLVANIIAGPADAGLGFILLAVVYVLSLTDLYYICKKFDALTVKNEMSCPKCEFTNERNSEYCIRCGTRIQNTCHKCGQLINSQMSYCGKCGYDLAIQK